ncbi:MAG: RrF2 family transcriptional regulator [Nitrospinota bacterium]
MKFSAKLEYALIALIYLKCEPDDEPVSGRELSEKLHIPYRFLEQILSDLKKAGLVRSVRGYKGGYRLNKGPSDITIYDVYQVTEGKLEPWDCEDSKERCNKNLNQCVISHFYADLKDTMKKLMQSYTLVKLCRTSQALRLNGAILPSELVTSEVNEFINR